MTARQYTPNTKEACLYRRVCLGSVFCRVIQALHMGFIDTGAGELRITEGLLLAHVVIESTEK